MAIGSTLDPSALDYTGADWFTANAPPDLAQPTTTATSTAPSTSFTNTATTPSTTPGQAGTYATGSPNDPTANLSDPKVAALLVQYWATQPGANPSLTNDPNYWIQKITSGELGTDKNYIISKFLTPEGANAGGFGAPPAPYASNPNAPTPPPVPTPPAALSTPYQVQGTAPTAPTLTPFTAPTEAQLEASPGYLSRLNAGVLAKNRSAASQGTVLNGGTQQGINRYAQDYASNEYGNYFNQSLATNQNNNAVAQTGFGDALNTFTSANQYGLAARQQNQNEFQQNVVQPTQTSFQNQYASYLNDNARTLQDYLTNYNISHTADTDYWSRLAQVSSNGLTAAVNSRAS